MKKYKVLPCICGATPEKEIIYSGKNKVRVYCPSCCRTTGRIMEDVEYCAVDLAYKDWNKAMKRAQKRKEKEAQEIRKEEK